MTSALLVIDVQQGLCAGRWAVWNADRLVERVNLVTARAREAGRLVVLVQHEEDDEDGLRHGSAAWQLAEGLVTAPGDLRVRKRASDAFHETDLDATLRARGIRDLVICGAQSEMCVDSTTRRALALGYPVTLVSDGHSTLDNGVLQAPQIVAHHNAALSSIGSYGPRVRLVPAAEVRFED